MINDERINSDPNEPRHVTVDSSGLRDVTQLENKAQLFADKCERFGSHEPGPAQGFSLVKGSFSFPWWLVWGQILRALGDSLDFVRYFINKVERN